MTPRARMRLTLITTPSWLGKGVGRLVKKGIFRLLIFDTLTDRRAEAALRQNSESRARVRLKRRYVHMDASPAIHFARVDFRNDRRVFGIKDEDRFLHVYVIGKTGTGKSTLLETMALQDLERGNGFALIDPHGDLVARIAARVPDVAPR